MQKKIIALAIAAAASSAAFAQTNVTLYGIVDAGINQTKFDGSDHATNAVHSGGLATSRIGFKGTEDLGNGLKALFTLEYTLAVDANAGIGDSAVGSTQARQQLVGLSDAKLGTVVAGRLQTAGWGFAAAGTALGGSTALGASHLAGSALMISAAGRANNAVAYVSPSFGGVTAEFNHARLTEAAGTVGADATGNLVGLSYANGPITAGVVYSKLSDSSSTATFLNNNSVKEWGVRAGYDFQVAKLQLQATSYKIYDGSTDATSDKKYVASLTVPVTAKGAVIAEYAKVNVKNDILTAGATANADRNAWTIAYKHDLSKRTSLYAGYTQLNTDSSNAQYVVSGVTKEGGDFRRVAAGVVHAF